MSETKMNDYLFGKNPSKTGVLLAGIGGLLVSGFVLISWLTTPLAWKCWQGLVIILISADLGSGLIANLLGSTRRFYSEKWSGEEPVWSKFIRHPLGFASLHIYPIIIWGVLNLSMVGFGLLWYILMVGMTFILIRLPKELFLPSAGLGIMLVILLNAYLIPFPNSMGWFIPLFFLKLTFAHLLPVTQEDQS